MKNILSLTLAFAIVAFLSILSSDSAVAQTVGNQYGKKAMEQYGPFDDDGDGIPNGQDPDFVKPKDGTGKKLGKLNRSQNAMQGKGNSYGPGNGTGNKGIGPKDGTGFGAGKGTGTGTGTGVCDGTGPKGKKP